MKKTPLAGQLHSKVFGIFVQRWSLFHTLNLNYTACAQSTSSHHVGRGPACEPVSLLLLQASHLLTPSRFWVTKKGDGVTLSYIG